MAQQQIDIGLDENEDIAIAAEDLITVESTAQHQRQLIMNNKGDFKQNPVTCVGAFGYLDDENFSGLTRAISIDFTRDGMDVVSVQLLPDGTINSDAYYK